MEGAQHSANTLAPPRLGEFHFCTLWGPPRILLLFSSFLGRLPQTFLSRPTSTHRTWGTLGLATYWAPSGQWHSSPFFKCPKLLGGDLSSCSTGVWLREIGFRAPSQQLWFLPRFLFSHCSFLPSCWNFDPALCGGGELLVRKAIYQAFLQIFKERLLKLKSQLLILIFVVFYFKIISCYSSIVLFYGEYEATQYPWLPG